MIKIKNVPTAVIILLMACVLIIGCAEPASNADSTTSADKPAFEIASEEYALLAEKAIGHLVNLDIDLWGEMLADNVDYYFPDGDANTRTKLTGKSEVLAWYNNWKETSGIEKMTAINPVHIPVQVNEQLNYSGLTGVLILSYFSNEMVYNGKPVSVRMHFVTHFNDQKLIDRYYSYYDRTPIINTVNMNILDAENR